MIGSLQATEVIKLALAIGQALIGSMIAYDALRATFQTLKVTKNPGCPICGHSPSITGLRDLL
jgi:adenylyltransferase/sulfurtransferase